MPDNPEIPTVNPDMEAEAIEKRLLELPFLFWMSDDPALKATVENESVELERRLVELRPKAAPDAQ